jgi:1-acyl-sn-glycerol-3-phosphate acyltransferase
MNFLRALAHLLIMAVTVVPWATAAVVLSPFLGHDRLYRFCVAWINLSVEAGTWLLGIRNRVTGMENLPQEKNARAVLLVKHQSTWETFCMAPLMLPRPLAYVFKRELIYIPFFGWAMASLHMIHIDRSQTTRAFRAVVQQGRAALDSGSWVIMFPEGTRIPRGQRGTYHPAGALLAIECDAVVIPVAVTSAKCWPRKAFVKHPGTVDISIGPPIPSAGRKPRDLMQDVENWIETEMRRLDPEAYAQAPQPTATSSVPDGHA